MARRWCEYRRATKGGKRSARGEYMQRRCFADYGSEAAPDIEASAWSKPKKIRAKNKDKAIRDANKRDESRTRHFTPPPRPWWKVW